MLYTPKIVCNDKIRRHDTLEFDMTQFFFGHCATISFFLVHFSASCKGQATSGAPAEQLVDSSSPDQQWTKGGYSICKCLS